MQFASDNWSGVAAPIMEAIAAEAARSGAAYGGSNRDKEVEARFSALFERDVAVYFVATGSAANGLAMSAANKAGGVIFCHCDCHMIEGECGGVEFLTGGARLHGVDGDNGLLQPSALEAAIAEFSPASEHFGRGTAISITQQTEAGTIYALDDIRQIADVARANGLMLHMDGARFANALARLDASPADMTWRAGVDILSFGGTKNGCMAAEAVIVFDPDRAQDLPFLRKRAGHLFSKARFVAAQFDAYLHDGLWLDLARHSNAMADALRAGLASSPHAREAWLTQGNEIFAVLRRSDAERLQAAGATFHPWTRNGGARLSEDELVVRFVTAFSTTRDEVDALFETLG